MNAPASYETTLQPYAEQWRCRRDGARIYCLLGRWGSVQPYSLDGKTICCVIQAKSPRHLSGILRTIKALPGLRTMLTQRGDEAAVLAFENSPSALKAIAGPLGLYQRRKYPNRQPAGVALQRRQP